MNATHSHNGAPPGWREVLLGDVVTLQRGFDITKKEQRPGPIPVVSSSGISSFHDESRANGPGVIIGRKGSLGTAYFVDGPYWPHDTTLWVKDFKGNDPFYCYLLLRSLPLASLDAGSSNPTLNRNHAHRLPVRIPPLGDQKRVAALIAAIDELITINVRRIALLDDLTETLYRDWFIRFRMPGEGQPGWLESPLGRIPAGWEVCSLEEICERITDGAHRSPPTVGSGLPMASVKDMSRRRLDLTTCRHVSVEDFAELERQHCRPRVGDVLVAKDGSYLKHVFAVEEDQAVVILSSIALLRTNERMRPRILALYLRQPEIRERLAGYVSGAAIPRIVLKDFRKFPVLLPPSDIQERFEQTAGPILEAAFGLDKLVDALRRTRDLLVPRLVSGRLDLSNVDLGDLLAPSA